MFINWFLTHFVSTSIQAKDKFGIHDLFLLGPVPSVPAHVQNLLIRELSFCAHKNGRVCWISFAQVLLTINNQQGEKHYGI